MSSVTDIVNNVEEVRMLNVTLRDPWGCLGHAAGDRAMTV
jgi:hypothetical protein